MKITSKFLHVPPHLSTSWTQVRAIYLREDKVVVTLIDGVIIEIPDLPLESRHAIFDAFAAFQEEQQHAMPQKHQAPPFQIFQVSPNPQGDSENPSMNMGFDSMESMASALQHNEAQANMPNLPDEVLHKIASIAKIIAPEDIENMPKPVANCNCPHCQIARAIHGGTKQIEAVAINEIPEEIISDNELAFQQWDIVQTGEKLYAVTNRLEPKERYSVYLGHPVGCTCGKQGCEHILAVLKS